MYLYAVCMYFILVWYCGIHMCFTLMPSKQHLLWKPYSSHETSNENKTLKHHLDLDNQVESIHNLYF
jgi:hypothetical protein